MSATDDEGPPQVDELPRWVTPLLAVALVAGVVALPFVLDIDLGGCGSDERRHPTEGDCVPADQACGGPLPERTADDPESEALACSVDSFDGHVTVAFSLAGSGAARLLVYDQLGTVALEQNIDVPSDGVYEARGGEGPWLMRLEVAGNVTGSIELFG